MNPSCYRDLSRLELYLDAVESSQDLKLSPSKKLYQQTRTSDASEMDAAAVLMSEVYRKIQLCSRRNETTSFYYFLGDSTATRDYSEGYYCWESLEHPD